MEHRPANPSLSRRAFTLGGATLLGAAAAGSLTGTARAAAPPSGGWADVPIPPLSGRAQLFGIAAPDPWHVIAGGTENAFQPDAAAVMLHRGLRGWTRAPLPEGLAVVNDVRARHFADAWALASGPDASARTDLLHWNGRRWSTAAGPADQQLYAIELDGTGALWATGITADGATVSVRRHGRWTNSLSVPGTAGLSAIAAGGPSDVWVGGIGGSSGPTPLWHFDGTEWTRMPWGTTYTHWILQIEHVAPDDVWFYALEQHPLFPPPTLHHWNGSEFTVHRMPGPSDPLGGVRPMSAIGFLGSIASDGLGGVWVSSPYDTSHLLHFDGASWTRETPPIGVTAYAMTRVPYTTTVWAGTQIGTVWRRSARPLPSDPLTGTK
ncbi:hypothetical protein [Actinomadura sp. 7K534]|uniref:hypothetical protein n=1 Tax=Actinomadura sp. 7K534 TaxID=2530366 RepID=UPI00104622C4|nr:hypothetical protein [Actinomadura sp. 7K534]TDB91370.1 hypothetical protein E1266_26835 [Actinomadura sp. 7K534]